MQGGTAKLAGYHFNPASPDTPRDVRSLRRKLEVLRSKVPEAKRAPTPGRCVAALKHLTGNSFK